MNKDWPTKDKDLHCAQVIMQQYARERDSNSLGLFEIEVNPSKKRMNYCLSGWVVLLAEHFASEYGHMQGNVITRQVITRCIIQGQTVH